MKQQADRCHCESPAAVGLWRFGRPILSAHYRFIVFVALLSAAGCERPPTPNQVVGTYSGTLNGAREILVLRSDGTFSQDLTLPSGQGTNASGSWSLKYKAVTLDRYLKFYDGAKNGALVEPQQVYGNIYRWGANMLIRDWDTGYYTLRKQ